MALGIYVVLRAIYVPFFSDEAMTFFFYVKTGGFDPFADFKSANNHVLNTALMRLSFLAFGDSPLALRLPNVLSYFLFAFYAVKIQKRFKEPMLGLAWLLLILGSHYFISFFHLARGYGMSMAFLLAAMYYLLSRWKGFDRKGFALFCFFISAAVWSNLSLLVPALAMYAFAGVVLVQQHIKIRDKRRLLFDILILLILGIIPFYGGIEIALGLKETGGLYHGTSKNFQEVIIHGFVKEFIPEYPQTAQNFFWPFFALYLIAITWICIRKKWTRQAVIAQGVFWLMLIGTVLMHLVLHVNYPLDRAALHFFPLFVLAFFTVADLIPLRFSLPVALIPGILFTFQQLSFLNLTHTSHWANENVPLEVLDYLHHWKDSTGQLPMVSAHGLPGRGLVYEVYRDPKEPIYPQFQDFPAANADFILTYQWVEDNPAGFVSRIQFPDVKMELLERAEPVAWQRRYQKTPVDIPFTTVGDTLVSFAIDGQENEAFYISFESELSYKQGPYKAWLALQLYDSSNQELAFYYIDLGRTKIPAGGAPVNHKLFKENLPPIPMKAVLRWMNVGGQEYALKDMEIDCYVKARGAVE